MKIRFPFAVHAFSGTRAVRGAHRSGVTALLCLLATFVLLAAGDLSTWASAEWQPDQADVVATEGPRVAASLVHQGDQGLEGGWPVDEDGNVQFYHSLSSRLPFIREAGAGWVRINFRLGACYPNWTSMGCNGRTALQAYDEVVANAQAQGLKVLGLISPESWKGSQAQWTANNAETAGGSGDNAYVYAFAQNAAAVLATHFAGRIADWEVWNEPNTWTNTDGYGHFWGGFYLYPSNYAWLLKRSYAAIKAAQPNSRVMFGGLFAHEPLGVAGAIYEYGEWRSERRRGDMPGARRPADPTSGDTVQPAAACYSAAPAGADSGASYLCATYAVGLSHAGWTPGAYPFDQVGQHPYLNVGKTASPSTISFYLQDLRNAYLIYEGPYTAKKIHVTEFGWPTNQVSPEVQAQNVRIAFQTLQATSYVSRSYWFTVQDAPYADLYYGLMDSEGTHKPSFAAYQAYGTYPIPTPTPTRTPTVTPTPTRKPTATPSVPPIPTAQTLYLHAGWNWFSINLLPGDSSVPAVLAPISGKYDYVLGETGTYAPSPAPANLNTLAGIVPGEGYMIRMREASTLTVAGRRQDPPPDLELWSGWHWMGYLGTGSRMLPWALESISGRYDVVLGWQGAYSPTGLAFLNNLVALEEGKGYLIKMNQPGMLSSGP